MSTVNVIIRRYRFYYYAVVKSSGFKPRELSDENHKQMWMYQTPLHKLKTSLMKEVRSFCRWKKVSIESIVEEDRNEG